MINDLTYQERYDWWFKNNYETGMEYNPSNIPNFDDEYWEPTPIKVLIIDNEKHYFTKDSWREYQLNNINIK